MVIVDQEGTSTSGSKVRNVGALVELSQGILDSGNKLRQVVSISSVGNRNWQDAFSLIICLAKNMKKKRNEGNYAAFEGQSSPELWCCGLGNKLVKYFFSKCLGVCLGASMRSWE